MLKFSNNSSSKDKNPEKQRQSFPLSLLYKSWSAIVLIIFLICLYLLPQSKINSNLFDLLPSQSEAQYDTTLLDGYLVTLDNQLVWLINNQEDGEKAASFWSDQLSLIPEITSIEGRKTEDSLISYGKYLLDHPALLPPVIIDKIQSEEYLEWIRSQIYSPFSGITIAEIKADPLLSTRAYVLEQLKESGQFSIQNGWITITEEDGTKWFLIRGELSPSASGMLQRQKIVTKLNQSIESLKAHYPQHQLLQKGSLFYSDYAAKTAEQDITTIGILSLLGVVFIFYLFFRSFKAITLTLTALSIGILFGVTGVLAIYREIHLITIVMSTSIIGVSIDYTLFFLTSRALEGKYITPQESLQKTFMPLLGALLSTCLAYAVLILAPFVGLEQLAFFTIFGLIAVFFTVIAWFPKFAKLPSREYPKFSIYIENYLFFWQEQKKTIWGITTLLVLVTGYGLLQIKADDDIGKLQTLPADILLQDQKISVILNQHATLQVLMVTGENEEALLQNIENSYDLLDQWQTKGIIESYRKLPFSSQKQQRSYLETLQNFYPKLLDLYKDSGFEHFVDPDFTQVISLDAWLKSPLSEGWKLLFQILPNKQSAFIIPITKIHDPLALKNSLQAHSLNENNNALFWIDRKGELSELFKTYRITMQWLLLIALSAITALFLITKGIKRGLLSSFPVLMAVLTPLGILGLLGISINLFTIMALILVVGMSIDYVLFFGSKNQPKIAFITILLAALISELTFGLLAASNTNAISNFGLILALGILTALLLAPYAKYSIFHQKDIS